MDKLVYVYYVLLPIILLWGAKFFFQKGVWNEEFMSLKQTKALQGFCAICIMFHHCGQKTCASWLNPKVIIPGLELFVPIGYFFVGVFLFCSGYGLFKSYKQKPDYLKGFFGRRMLPVITAFYSSTLVFLMVRFLIGERIGAKVILGYLLTIRLGNPNAWFAIVLPIFYLFFYLAFRFCKKDGLALFVTVFLMFVYTLLGTIVNHNQLWLCGEWWYNSVHFFALGLLFARFEQPIVKHMKKFYLLYLIAFVIGLFGFYLLSEYAQATFTYYGENFHAPDTVFRRWVCLLSQMAASCCFVFLLFTLGMKIKIGNKVLAFMGGLTLEFYLIHGLYVELFGFDFLNFKPSIYYIKNVAIYVLVVTVLGVISAYLLQKFDKWVVRVLTSKKQKKVS